MTSQTKYSCAKSAFTTLLLLYLIIGKFVGTSNARLISASIRMERFYIVQRVEYQEDSEMNQEDGNSVEDENYNEIFPGTPYTNCGSSANIQRFQVSGCNGIDEPVDVMGTDDFDDNDYICNIKRGATTSFSITFVSRTNATRLNLVVHAKVGIINKKLPVPQPDACRGSGIVCPIISGKQYIYKVNLPVKRSLPKVKAWLTGQLLDENNRNVLCTKLHVKLV